MTLAIECLESLLACVRDENLRKGFTAVEYAEAFLAGPYGEWLGRAAEATAVAGADPKRLGDAFLHVDRATRAISFLLRTEYNLKEDDSPGAVAWKQGETEWLKEILPSCHTHYRDLIQILRGIRGALGDPRTEQILPLFEKSEAQSRRFLYELDKDKEPEPEETPSPLITLVDALLADAVGRGATAASLIPGPAWARIDYEIAERPSTFYELSTQLYKGVRARIKILAGLDIVEHKRPEEGWMNPELIPQLSGWKVFVCAQPTKYQQKVRLELRR